MDVVTGIRDGFASGKKHAALPVPCLEAEYPAWVLRGDDWFGVGIYLESNEAVSEKFANASLATRFIRIDDKDGNMLILSSTMESLRNEFAAICAQFVDPGTNGLYRKEILSYPGEWWYRWRNLLGNAIHEQKVQGILGEMHLLLHLLAIEGTTCQWTGPMGGRHDIETPEASFEVKSTIDRYGVQIEISGHHQLQAEPDKPLELAFFRFEPSVAGKCVNELVDMLVAQGYCKDEIEAGLGKIGIEEGRSARNTKYALLEARIYHVKDDFPRITKSTFKGDKVPDGIVKVSYTVDLSSRPYMTIGIH